VAQISEQSGMSGKKGMYHSELVKMSPVTALIMSEPTESKFPDRPRWVALEINGEERFLSCENVSIELALAGLKGQWARLNALGRGEEAIIQIEDAPGRKSEGRGQRSEGAYAKAKAQMQAPAKNDEDGVLAARKHIMQAANLYNLCVACVDKVIAPAVPQIAQTSDMFQAAVGTLFIEASRVGFVAKMPDKPL
jgi:hypothetical protein